MSEISIRIAKDDDFDSIYNIFHAVVKLGNTHTYFPDTNKEDAYQLWMPPHKETFVAIVDNNIVGTYFLRANQIGLGSHIANAAYMVHPSEHGKGIGTLMAKHSINRATEFGYHAMQFNIVVSTNEKAVNLWKKCGFKIIGNTPNGFNHSTLGYVDTYIMYKPLK